MSSNRNSGVTSQIGSCNVVDDPLCSLMLASLVTISYSFCAMQQFRPGGRRMLRYGAEKQLSRPIPPPAWIAGHYVCHSLGYKDRRGSAHVDWLYHPGISLPIYDAQRNWLRFNIPPIAGLDVAILRRALCREFIRDLLVKGSATTTGNQPRCKNTLNDDPKCMQEHLQHHPASVFSVSDPTGRTYLQAAIDS